MDSVFPLAVAVAVYLWLKFVRMLRTGAPSASLNVLTLKVPLSSNAIGNPQSSVSTLAKSPSSTVGDLCGRGNRKRRGREGKWQ